MTPKLISTTVTAIQETWGVLSVANANLAVNSCYRLAHYGEEFTK